MHFLLILYIGFHVPQVIRAEVGSEAACDFQARAISDGIFTGKASDGYVFDPVRLPTYDEPDIVGMSSAVEYKCLPITADGEDARTPAERTWVNPTSTAK